MVLSSLLSDITDDFPWNQVVWVGCGAAFTVCVAIEPVVVEDKDAQKAAVANRNNVRGAFVHRTRGGNGKGGGYGGDGEEEKEFCSGEQALLDAAGSSAVGRPGPLAATRVRQRLYSCGANDRGQLGLGGSATEERGVNGGGGLDVNG